MGADVPTYILFDAHLSSFGDVQRSVEGTLKKPVAWVFVAAENKASSRQWPSVEHRPPAFSFPVPTYEHKPGATSSSDHAVGFLANTIAGALRTMGRAAFRPHLVPGADLPTFCDAPTSPLLRHPDLEERVRSPSHRRPPRRGRLARSSPSLTRSTGRSPF